jgi:small redox-active disulfide protein 2
MLSIKVLGPGCANCKRLEQMTRRVVADMGIAATIEKITDYGEIVGYGVLATPGLVINERVVSSGRVPAREEIYAWLEAWPETA